MQAAGPQGPIPASDVVIEGLPRYPLTEESLEKSVYKDCPVCKEDFNPSDEVMLVPCGHIFHPDCLQPWLKTNGSCPVCRFSLVPDESDRTERPAGSGDHPTGGPSMITNALQRLFGQSGASVSTPASPSHEAQSPGFSTTSDPMANSVENVHNHSSCTTTVPEPRDGNVSDQSVRPDGVSDISASIPEDYREMHRRREREQQERPPMEDVD